MNNKTYDMFIIGAGIAGLATGCYARMNGYEIMIDELHDKPGGCVLPGTEKVIRRRERQRF